MVSGRRHWLFVILPLVMLMVLTACERPLASNESETAEQAAEATAIAETAEGENTGDEAVDNSAEEGAEEPTVVAEEVNEDEEAGTGSEVAEEAESDDPNVGGGTPDTAAEEEVSEVEGADQGSAAEGPTEEAVADESTTDADSEETEEAAEGEEAAAEVEETTAEDEDVAAEDEEEAAEAEEAAAEAEETAAEVEEATAEAEETASEDEETTSEQETTADGTTLPATHTVAPGENLYRIGLKYGMSWVTLAAYNNLPNANYIRVGQVLQIPGGGTPSPAPPPTPPDETGYVNYVVQRGDTLNSIARKYGVSWVEIAEANGIVNPNLIYAGQVLKIPTTQPETPPSATHTVRSGETLFRISLQYGVSWLAIAQANDIAPPYIIYPGQVLTIPSG